MSPSSATLDALAERFAAACRAGQSLFPESLLGEAPEPARPELLRRLLRVEIDIRQQQGRPLPRIEAEGRLAGLGPWASDVLDSFWPADDEVLTLRATAGPLAGQTFRVAGHSTFLVGRGPKGVQWAIEG
ncbi:MAG: hypothetical protein ACRC33_14265, partial [Gemmataceae bacterium]